MTAFLLFVLIFACFKVNHGADSNGDLPTTHGKEFYLAYFNKWTSDLRYDSKQPITHIQISSQSDGNCTVRYKTDRYPDPVDDIFILLRADSTVQQTLDYKHVSYYSENIDSAIYLTCSEVVSVYVMNEYNNGSLSTTGYFEVDSYTALPVTSLATEFLIPGSNFTTHYPILGIASGPAITSVNIKLNTTCGITYEGYYYKSGDIIFRTFTEWNVLQIGNDLDCDFGGTLIQSDKPIAVFSGSTYVKSASNFKSHPSALLQVPPVSSFGTHIIAPNVDSMSRKNNIRVLASQDKTNIKVQAINGGTVTNLDVNLDRAQFHDFRFNDEIHSVFRSNKPILVVQLAENFDTFGAFLSYPDVGMYEKQYTIASMQMDDSLKYSSRYRGLTIIAKTSAKASVNVTVPGESPLFVNWDHITGTDYSIGTCIAQYWFNSSEYHIVSDDPVLVRLDSDYISNYREKMAAFVAGYRQPLVSVPNKTKTGPSDDVFTLECRAQGWVVSVDLSVTPTDVSNIYMGEDRCTGVLQGDLLTFRFSYDQCGTEFQVKDNTMVYKNRLVRKKSNAPGSTEWVKEIQCSKSTHEVDTLHLGEPVKDKTLLSGVIEEKLVNITLYGDRTFRQPMVITTDLAPGTDVFVKVGTPSSSSMFLVVNECDLIIGNSGGEHGSVPLIKDGCSAANGTVTLATRNEMTLFKFVMFDFGNDQSGLLVTCDVTFCDKMDFSPKCDQRCHNSLSSVLIG